MKLSTLVILATVALLASCGTVRNGGGLIGGSSPQQNIQFCQTSPNIWEVCKREYRA